jgi:CBS domain-containing protein
VSLRGGVLTGKFRAIICIAPPELVLTPINIWSGAKIFETYGINRSRDESSYVLRLAWPHDLSKAKRAAIEATMSILPLTLVTNSCFQIPGLDPWHATPQDPALTVMTDFRERASVTVPDTALIDEALEHMRHTGVRCAFAIDDRKSTVVGLITAYDITGEKPIQCMQSQAIPRREVLVRDIMQEISECPVADIKQIERATVAAVSNMFAKNKCTHVPVVETSETGEQRLRGLLSAAKVKRLLSQSVSTSQDLAGDATHPGRKLRTEALPAITEDSLLTPFHRAFR